MKDSPARFADLAGTRLYRRNIFAVTGLPVDAQGRAVRRQRARLDARLAVEETWPGDDGTPAPDGYRKEEVRLAFEEFQDPRGRLVDELLWYWRDADLGCGCDPVTHLRHDDAVERHSRAIEAETGAIDLTEAERTGLWDEAAACWEDLLDSPDLRAHIARRLTDLADPRLDGYSSDDFLPGFPRLLVSPFAELAGDRAVRPRLAAACDPWMTCPAFAAALHDTFEEPVTEAVERVGQGLRLAAEEHHADRNWDALQLLGDRVLPAFGELEPLKPFASESQYEELAHTVAVAVNNVALSICDDSRPSRGQKDKAVDLLETAYEIAPERDEDLIHQNLLALYEHGATGSTGARQNPGGEMRTAECAGCMFGMAALIGGVIAGATAGWSWAVGIIIGGFVLMGVFSS
ncbi:hypothetical protein [Streptomyces sp. MAR4 CNX-425]|uniref:hypothetical protein n=1 Tax=Streptomyces sp. MAR4 CNX-425 TaxID=3406343 RepID=UPI003B50A640